MIKATYTDVNLNNCMESYVSCFHLTYCKTLSYFSAQTVQILNVFFFSTILCLKCCSQLLKGD